MTCLDASALVKLFVSEVESDALNASLLGATDIVVSDLAVSESASALGRRMREGQLTRRAARDPHRQMVAFADRSIVVETRARRPSRGAQAATRRRPAAPDARRAPSDGLRMVPARAAPPQPTEEEMDLDREIEYAFEVEETSGIRPPSGDVE